MTWKSTAVASSVTVVGMWLASYAPVGRPAGGVSTPGTTGTAQSSIDIQHEARRLHDRLEHVGAYREPARNPFSFAPPRRRPVLPAAEREPVIEDVPAAIEPEPPAFRLSLAGIAEDGADGAVVRTAVISTPDGVLLVKTGDVVGDRYTVAAIGPGSVDLARLDDGTPVRLSLRP